jgi:hypothetical protein
MTAPAWLMASHETKNSGLLVTISATKSPTRIPRATSALLKPVDTIGEAVVRQRGDATGVVLEDDELLVTVPQALLAQRVRQKSELPRRPWPLRAGGQ